MALATLSIDLVAKLATFEKDMGIAARAAEKNAQRIAGAMGAARASITALAGLGATAIFTGAIQSTAQFQDEMGKLAQRSGVTVEAFSALDHAAMLADVSREDLSKGLKELSKDIDAGGVKLKALGINATTADGAMLQFAERISKIQDPARKVAEAADLLGDRFGPNLIPLLNQGAAGLKGAADEAARFGLIVTTEASAAAEEFNDNLARLAKLAEGAKIAITSDLVKGLGESTKAFLDANTQAGLLAGSIAFIQTLLTGSDRFKADKSLFDLTDKLLQAENALSAARADGMNPEGIAKREKYVQQLQAEIKTTQAYRRVLDDYEKSLAKPTTTADPPRKPPKTPKTKATPIDESATSLAAYVKGLSGAIEKTDELNESQKALNFLRTIGATGEVAQVRELVLGLAVKKDAADQERALGEVRLKNMELSDRVVLAQTAENDAIAERLVTMAQEIEEIGLTAEALERLKLARLDNAIAQKQLDLIGARNIENNAAEIAQIERRINLLQRERELTGKGAIASSNAAAAEESKEFAATLNQDVKSALSNAFRDTKDPIGAFGDALGNVVYTRLTEAAGTALANILVGDGKKGSAGGVLGGLLGSLFGFKFADGGVMTRAGPVPLRKYANGGIATRPQLALYGEGSTPEAYVPLPDGRRIPVAMKGGGGGTVIHQVNNFTVGDVATVSMVRQAVAGSQRQGFAALQRSRTYGGAASL
jgi:hypothetical protein